MPLFCKRLPRTAWMAIAVLIATAAPVSHRVEARPQTAAATPAPARFSVEVVGSGPDVILIPGLNTPRAVWQPVAVALKLEHRVHLIQLRGFGDAAGANANGPVLAPFVAELGRYIAENHLHKPAVIGHSMGGLAALMLAADQPGLPGKIMVVDAVPFIGTLFAPSATVDGLRPRAEQMRDAMLARAAARPPAPPRDCSAVTGEAPAMPGAMVRSAKGACMVGNWMASADPQVGAQAMLDDMTTDMRPRLSDITAPLTVLHSQDERVISPEDAARIYREAYVGAREAKLVAVPGAAHFVMLDQPEITLAAIHAFLSAK